MSLDSSLTYVPGLYPRRHNVSFLLRSGLSECAGSLRSLALVMIRSQQNLA